MSNALLKTKKRAVVVTPIPAARTRIPPVSSTPSPRRDTDLVGGQRDHSSRSTDQSPSARGSSTSSDEDDLSLDGQSLDMFASRNELDQATKTQNISVSKQLELQARQQAEIYRLKLVEEEKARKVEETLAREKPDVEPTKRRKWDRPPQKEFDLLATQNESCYNSDDEVHLTVPRKLRAPSRGSSVSEFFSLSEGEDDDVSPIQQAVREEDEELADPQDPDQAFASMCMALARRKQQAEPELPVEVDETIELEDDVDLFDNAGSIRRSCSEPGWISEKSFDPAAPHPTTSPARRSSSFDGGNRCKNPDVPDDLQIFPPLSSSFFSSVL